MRKKPASNIVTKCSEPESIDHGEQACYKIVQCLEEANKRVSTISLQNCEWKLFTDVSSMVINRERMTGWATTTDLVVRSGKFWANTSAQNAGSYQSPKTWGKGNIKYADSCYTYATNMDISKLQKQRGFWLQLEPRLKMGNRWKNWYCTTPSTSSGEEKKKKHISKVATWQTQQHNLQFTEVVHQSQVIQIH